MPQASDELRAKMNDYFGDPINDGPPIEYLLSQGFILLRSSYDWVHPRKIWIDLNEKERDCINFMFSEWDYGGFREYPKIGSIWRHRKGGVYVVVGRGRNSDRGEPSVSYVRVNSDETEWQRTLSEFADGRFTKMEID